MPATPLLDDGISVTYQLDDGSTVKVAKDAAARIGAPMPAPAPAPIASGIPGGPAAAQSIPDQPAPIVHGLPDAGPDVSAPQPGYGVQPQTPIQNAPNYSMPAPQAQRIQAADAAATQAYDKANAPARGGKPASAPAAPVQRFGQVTAEHDQADQQMQQALKERAIAEQAANQTVSNTLTDRNAQLDLIRAKQEADQQKSLAEIERRSHSVDAAIDDYSRVKIDPNRLSNSISAGGKAGMIFFQILSGLGQALKHQGGSNPAVDMWLKQQDQDERLQMDARDQAKDRIGQMKDSLSMFKDLAQTRAGTYNLAMAAETDKAAKTLEQIAAQTKSDLVKSNALEASGLLKQQSASFKGQWAVAEFEADQKVKDLAEKTRAAKASEGVAYGHLALAQKQQKEGVRQFDAELAQKEQFHKDEMTEKSAALALKGNKTDSALAAEQAKDGVYDPRTGNAMLQPEGEKMMRDADALEKAARKEKDPAKAAQYTQAAKETRDNAVILHGFRTPQAEKVKESISHAQELIDTVADIKATLGTDPSSADRETWAALGSKFEQAKAAWIESVGAKVSSREMDAISEMFGHNPTDLTVRAIGRGKLGATLDAVSDGTVRSTAAKIKGQGYRGQWRPEAPKSETIDKLQGQTSVEARDAAAPSPIARAERAVLNPAGYATGGTFDPETRAEESAAAAGGPTGLTAEDTGTVQKLAKQYENGNDEQRAKIVEQMTSYALSPRISLASGVVSLVKGESPDLFNEVTKNLPADRRQDLGIIDVAPRGAKK